MEEAEEAAHQSTELIEDAAVVTLVQRQQQQQPDRAISGLLDGYDYAWQWNIRDCCHIICIIDHRWDADVMALLGY